MSEAAAAPEKQGSVWEDCLEVLWAPATVFDRSRARGVGMYLLVLTAILAVIIVATKGLLQPYVDANYDMQVIQMAKQTQKPMPAEAVAAGRTAAGYIFLVFAALTPVLSGLLGGLANWGGAKILRVPLTLGRGVFIATLASVPRVLSFLSTAVQGAVLDTSNVTSLFSASLGPARFVDPATTSPAVLGLLASIDVFAVWTIVITAVGVSVVTKTSRSSGWLVSVVAWALVVLLSLVPAALA
ncbi:hypothetical protein [Gemmatimonas sp.]|uniref:hypothetical protein n=1 Tax=Gemmatimonas sp. TaxID=1962908 RepID=UPI00333FAB78